MNLKEKFETLHPAELGRAEMPFSPAARQKLSQNLRRGELHESLTNEYHGNGVSWNSPLQ